MSTFGLEKLTVKELVDLGAMMGCDVGSGKKADMAAALVKGLKAMKAKADVDVKDINPYPL